MLSVHNIHTRPLSPHCAQGQELGVLHSAFLAHILPEIYMGDKPASTNAYASIKAGLQALFSQTL